MGFLALVLFWLFEVKDSWKERAVLLIGFFLLAPNILFFGRRFFLFCYCCLVLSFWCQFSQIFTLANWPSLVLKEGKNWENSDTKKEKQKTANGSFIAEKKKKKRLTGGRLATILPRLFLPP